MTNSSLYFPGLARDDYQIILEAGNGDEPRRVGCVIYASPPNK